MKKSTFLPKCNFFFLFAQIWHFCTKIDIDRNTSDFPSKFARHYSITVLSNSHICPKTDAFCIKCYFLLKENNATKNWHFSKTEDTSLKKNLISPLNTNIFENGDHLLQKWKKKNPSKLTSLHEFPFYLWNTHNEKTNASKTNCHFFFRIDI